MVGERGFELEPFWRRPSRQPKSCLPRLCRGSAAEGPNLRLGFPVMRRFCALQGRSRVPCHARFCAEWEPIVRPRRTLKKTRTSSWFQQLVLLPKMGILIPLSMS